MYFKFYKIDKIIKKKLRCLNTTVPNFMKIKYLNTELNFFFRKCLEFSPKYLITQAKYIFCLSIKAGIG